ncbi:MAG: cell division protein SepF [Bacilli bacterium]|nr:cell division protein SepF [Bacilli bacterium]
MGLNDFIGKFTKTDIDGGDIDNTREIETDGGLYTGGEEGNKIILLEPRAFSESQDIADYLKRNNSVVVNLKRVTPEQAKRIVDFLSGTLYAIDGGLQKLGGGIFLCTPSTVQTDGVIGEEDNNAKPGKNKNNDDDFDW